MASASKTFNLSSTNANIQPCWKGGTKDEEKGREAKQRRDEGEDKEEQYANDRRSRVNVCFTDLFPPSLFM